MSKFTDKKNEIKEAAKVSGKKTFNRTQFDELATALLNEPSYVAKVATTKDGKEVIVEHKPVEAFRQQVIGAPLKEAGVDAAEGKKLVDEFQWNKPLPIHRVVSAMLEEYMDAGKSFAMERRDDFQLTLRMTNKDEEIKTSRTPGKKGETTTSRYAAHRIVKATSKCPNNKKTKI